MDIALKRMAELIHLRVGRGPGINQGLRVKRLHHFPHLAKLEKLGAGRDQKADGKLYRGDIFNQREFGDSLQ